LEFCRITSSVLLLGQGILQLALTIFLLLWWLRPSYQWQLLAQFFNSLLVLLLSGWLINQSYIHWQEEVTVLTADALPVLLLSCAGLFFLSRLFLYFNEDQRAFPQQKMLARLLPYLSAGLAFMLLLTHFTGWYWLDNIVGGIMACILAVGAVFFLLDGYWNMLEFKY
jgi:Co/Zn/Cd efflux system component